MNRTTDRGSPRRRAKQEHLPRILSMKPNQQELIRRWNDELSRETTLEMVRSKDDRSAAMAAFCEDLASLAPKVSIRRIKSDDEELPAIRLLPNLMFHGVPSENELEPFLEITAAVAQDPTPGDLAGEKLKGLDLPAALELFVAPQCIHCPSMVRRISPLAIDSKSVLLSIIDAELFHEKAGEYGIRSVPTLLLDGKFRWNGAVPLSDVTRMILSRDPANLSQSAISSFLQEGEAGKVTAMMIEHQTVFPALVDLLTHEKWPRRLGAMVAMENLAEENPSLAARAVPSLMDRLDHLTEDVKGDVVYILGEIGGPDLLPVLERIAAAAGKDSPELAESATEAIERITRK
ncbi:MAG: thioredoxin family protein [Desulfobacterales bacterium]|nr:thioredoxin family protein [Desulfobacterales bacterium]